MRRLSERLMCLSLLICKGLSTSITLPPSSFPNPTATASTYSSASSLDDVGSGSGSVLDPFAIFPTPVTPRPIIGLSTIHNANLSMDFVGDGLCQCDLLVKQCDNLCCCDSDCSDVATTMVFNCTSISSSEVCLDLDVVHSSLSQCSCTDSSLLCIIYEQDPSSLNYGSPVEVEDSDEFSKFELLHVLPGDGILRTLEVPAYSSSVYMVGDPIKVLMNNTAQYFDVFTLPTPFNGMQCHDGNPITYLINREHECIRHLDDLLSECASLFNLTQLNLKILPLPEYQSSDGIDAAGIPITVFCLVNTSKVQLCQPMPSYYNLVNATCDNIVLKAIYTIFHDGSGEIVNVSVMLTYGKVGQGSFIQQYKVEFIETPTSNDYQLKRSGNPGYLSEEIILAGSMSELGVIDITIDNSLWLHIKDSSSNCLAERSKVPVRFKQDLLTVCLVIISSADLIDDCSGARQRAYSTFDTDVILTHVGKYGNSNPSNISQWLEIINETVNVGATEEVSQRFLCTNVPTTLDITILYSLTGDFSNAQPVLSGIRFTYSTQNIVAEIIRSGKLVMRTSVTFVDTTTEPQQVLQSITGTIMRLPQDFIYPLFISQGICITFNCVTILLSLIISSIHFV